MTDDQTERLAADLTQPWTPDQTERMSDDATERIGEEATERIGADVTERIAPEAEDVTQPWTPDKTERMGEEPTERMGEERTERFSSDADLAETYVHFGPGVPVPAAAPDRATAIWRGEVDEGGAGTSGSAGATTVRTSRPGGQRWILPLTVLILVVAVLAYFLFGRSTSSLSITGASVRVSSATLACSQQETLTGVIATSGGAGTVSYQWVRSDGTKSDVLHQEVSSGEKLVDVTLQWSFEGTGSMHATAVLDILGPGTARSASASFVYSCSG